MHMYWPWHRHSAEILAILVISNHPLAPSLISYLCEPRLISAFDVQIWIEDYSLEYWTLIFSQMLFLFVDKIRRKLWLSPNCLSKKQTFHFVIWSFQIDFLGRNANPWDSFLIKLLLPFVVKGKKIYLLKVCYVIRIKPDIW